MAFPTEALPAKLALLVAVKTSAVTVPEKVALPLLLKYQDCSPLNDPFPLPLLNHSHPVDELPAVKSPAVVIAPAKVAELVEVRGPVSSPPTSGRKPPPA